MFLTMPHYQRFLQEQHCLVLVVYATGVLVLVEVFALLSTHRPVTRTVLLKERYRLLKKDFGTLLVCW